MSDNNSGKIAIIVAFIGFVGTIVAALITSGFFKQNETPSTPIKSTKVLTSTSIPELPIGYLQTSNTVINGNVFASKEEKSPTLDNKSSYVDKTATSKRQQLEIQFEAAPTKKQLNGSSSLRFNGLYVHRIPPVIVVNNRVTEYLRFFPDGLVIYVRVKSTSENLESENLQTTQVWHWFRKGEKYVSYGNYQMRGNHLKFKTTGTHSDMSFLGTIDMDLLKLSAFFSYDSDWYSAVFKFIEIKG